MKLLTQKMEHKIRTSVTSLKAIALSTFSEKQTDIKHMQMKVLKYLLHLRPPATEAFHTVIATVYTETKS